MSQIETYRDPFVDCYTASMVGKLAQWNRLPFDSALYSWCLSWKDASVFDCGNRQPRVSSLSFFLPSLEYIATPT